MQTALQIQTFLDDRHQHVNGDGNPDLGSDRILRCAVESLDPQMLLDPAKEQFHLPTTPIELGDGQSGQQEIVGEKDKRFLAHSIVVSHSAQSFGIAPLGHRIVEHHDLIALQASLFVDGVRIQTPAVEAFFGAGHKERPD